MDRPNESSAYQILREKWLAENATRSHAGLRGSCLLRASLHVVTIYVLMKHYYPAITKPSTFMFIVSIQAGLVRYFLVNVSVMINPAIVNITSFFYPIGNTPAICLTQDLPYQHPADILLLGCGDVRNILFTTYADTSPPRKLDITCCDIESAVLARNILLFSLLMDDVNGRNTASIWSIYYHFYVDDNSLELLQAQSKKLQKFATSVEVWHGTEYGAVLRFCDNETFLSVQRIWKSYCVSDLSPLDKGIYDARFKAGIQKAVNARVAFLGEGHVITGLRSAAPTSLQAEQDLPNLYKYFWDHGFTGEATNKKDPNPMFASLVTDTFTLHYGLDPLLGYHLSTAYIPLDKKSPLKQTVPVRPQVHKVVEAAYLQFAEWSASFREHARHLLTLRFVAGDVLAVCNAIHLGKDAQYQYRSQYELYPMIFDGEDYKMGLAPLYFDIIDTSNLADHVGIINILVVASVLLKRKFPSTLYTELLVMRQRTREELLNALLHGHFSTMSILLGLTPVEYWMNNTAVSTIDEDLFDTLSKLADGKMKEQVEKGQMRSRLAWKLSIPISDLDGTRPEIRFVENDLAHLLHSVYQRMFQHEDIQKLFLQMDLMSLRNQAYAHYHRGSLALLLKFIKGKVQVDWDAMMEIFLGLVETDKTTSMGLNYIQEFYTQLHILGVYSMPTFNLNYDFQHQGKFTAGLGSWKNIPPTVYVTLKVPRSKLEVFTTLSPAKLGTPIVHCILESGPQSTSRWQNIFADVHLVFGKTVSSGSRSEENHQVDITQDTQGWKGESPLIVSFRASSYVVLFDPQSAIVSFGVQSTPQSSTTFMGSLGLEMNVYTTKLTDKDHVFITESQPHKSGCRPAPKPVCHDREGNILVAALNRQVFTAKLDSQKAQIVALTGRIDGFSAGVKASLKDNATVNVTQISPFTLALQIGQSHLYNLNFPAPVIRTRSNTRIARKSFYIEITAPIADHINGDGFPNFMYPTFVSDMGPVLWNLPCLNLEHLPIIDIAKKSDLNWLTTHVSLQLSARERKLRERQEAKNGERHGDPRIDFKDSIFSMFIHFSGLQGHKAHVFGLNHPTGGGIHILVFVACLRLDMANHTVVLDAAILPLTDQLMPKICSCLDALSGMGICQIRVDDEELRLWRENLASFVERSRQWEHGSSCEYQKASAIPLSVQKGQQMLCSCGIGKLPPNFVSGVPHWNILSKYAVRAAISPSFSLPYIEKIFDFDGISLPATSKVDVCQNCHKNDLDQEVKLKKCSRCGMVKYCSTECQRSDWKAHKGFCVAVGKSL